MHRVFAHLHEVTWTPIRDYVEYTKPDVVRALVLLRQGAVERRDGQLRVTVGKVTYVAMRDETGKLCGYAELNGKLVPLKRQFMQCFIEMHNNKIREPRPIYVYRTSGLDEIGLQQAFMEEANRFGGNFLLDSDEDKSYARVS